MGEYKVEWRGGSTWAVTYVVPLTTTHVALTTSIEDAEKIAKALNEAEGL
jgi:hypothetical protein